MEETTQSEGYFSLGVKYREGTTNAEKEACVPFIKEFTQALSEAKDDHIPWCMDSITVIRDRHE